MINNEKNLLEAKQRTYIQRAQTDPLYFAEKFLQIPIPGEENEGPKPYRATYAQKQIFKCKRRTKWIAAHRRAGKSTILTLFALWHAIFFESRRIMILAPSSKQLTVLFDQIDEWIRYNPILKDSQADKGNYNQPNPRRTFITGSIISGFITGMNEGGEDSIRGQSADVIFVDEAQEMSDSLWKVVEPIMTGDRFRMGKVYNYITGTINHPAGKYYEKVMKEGNDFEKRNHEEVIYVPITDNVISNGGDYTPEQIVQIQSQTKPYIWETEWLLQIGEADTAVFKPVDIERANQEDWPYSMEYRESQDLVRFIGIDWDKTQAGTNIACIQYEKSSGRMWTLWREEIDHGQFTYIAAVEAAIQAYVHFKPDLIIADQGNGEVQWELLYTGSVQRNLDLHEKLIKMPFNSKLEVPDPQTGEMVKKMFKPTMVGMLQRKFQDGLMNFPRSDTKLKEQFMTYVEKSRTNNTIKYSSTNEHIIDCHLLALYGIWYLYENFLEYHQGSQNFITNFDNPVPSFEDSRVVDSFWNNLSGTREDSFGTIVRSNFGDWGHGVRGRF